MRDRRITPRSLPARKVYYDDKDIKLLITHFQEHFRRSFVKKPSPIVFESYIKIYDRYNPNGVFLKAKNYYQMDPARITKYCRYLGHSEEFAQELIRKYQDKNQVTFQLIREEKMFGLWFDLLLRITPFDEIYRALLPDDTARIKWEKRLRTCKFTVPPHRITWDDIKRQGQQVPCLSDSAVAKITVALFKKEYKTSLEQSAITQRLKRWKKGGMVKVHHRPQRLSKGELLTAMVAKNVRPLGTTEK